MQSGLDQREGRVQFQKTFTTPCLLPTLHTMLAHFLAHFCVCVFVCSFIWANTQTNKQWDQECWETFWDLSTECKTRKEWKTLFVESWKPNLPSLCIFLCIEEIQSNETGLSNTMDIKGIYISSVLCKIQMQLWIDLQSALSKFVANKTKWNSFFCISYTTAANIQGWGWGRGLKSLVFSR